MIPPHLNPWYEAERAKLADAMEDLEEAQIPFDRDIKVVIMVEVPSAVLMRQATCVALTGQLTMSMAVGGVIVDHAGGLHEGITNRAAHKTEALFFERLADRIGQIGGGRHVAILPELVLYRHAVDEADHQQSAVPVHAAADLMEGFATDRVVGHVDAPAGQLAHLIDEVLVDVVVDHVIGLVP